MKLKILALSALIGIAWFADSASAQVSKITPKVTQTAISFFEAGLQDSEKLPFVLAGLRSTKSPALLPLYKLFLESSEKSHRMIATVQIAQIAGKDAVPYLRARFLNDSQMVIRVRALLELQKLNALQVKDLQKVIKLQDQELQLLCARALIRKNKANLAEPVLQKLTKSKDINTAIFARMSLVRAGDQIQVSYLKRFANSEEASTQLKLFMLSHITEDKIEALLPVVKLFTQSPINKIRVRAYQALLALQPTSTREISRTILASDSIYLQINLLRLLADSKKSPSMLKNLSSIKGTAGQVARFEYNRLTKNYGKSQVKLVTDLLAEREPIIIEYVLNRMRQDTKKIQTSADFYTPGVLKYINSEKLSEQGLTRTNDRVAQAIYLLADLDTRQALAGIKKLLQTRNNDTLVMLTTGALYRSDNPSCADLVRPLLKSPVANIRHYAAITCAKFGDPSAIPVLIEIQQSKLLSGSTDLLTLTNWYLLKLGGIEKNAFISITKSLD